MYEIQSKVPVPRKATGGGPTPKYPFERMKKGDSFAIPTGKDARAAMRRLSAAAQAFRRRHGGKFTLRTFPKEVRIWRVE